MQQAGAAQKRGEVLRLAMQFQHLGVQFRHEGRRGQPFPCGDLVEYAPERIFQPDAGALTIETHPAGFKRVAVRVLPGEYSAHGFHPPLSGARDTAPARHQQRYSMADFFRPEKPAALSGIYRRLSWWQAEILAMHDHATRAQKQQPVRAGLVYRQARVLIAKGHRHLVAGAFEDADRNTARRPLNVAMNMARNDLHHLIPRAEARDQVA